MTLKLDVRELTVSFQTGTARRTVLGPVRFTLGHGETLGIIGESGSGKSTIAYALLDLLSAGGRLDTFQAWLDGIALHELTRREHRALLGSRIAFIPQEPLSALNPTLRVGRQVDLVLKQHVAHPFRARFRLMCDALGRIGITEPERVLGAYPFELSGGQVQRVLIAQAIALGAGLIIADEPTTALDVTVQKDVLTDLSAAVGENGRSLLFISHSIALVWSLCDRVLVLQNGAIMEEGRTSEILPGSQHPYTRQLIAALPSLSPARTPLPIGLGGRA